MLLYQEVLTSGNGRVLMIELVKLVFTAAFSEDLILYSSIAIAVGMALEIVLSLLGNSLYKIFNYIERS